LEAALDETALADFYDQVDSIPVEERKAWTGSSDYLQHVQSMEEERRLLRVPLAAKRPYGAKSDVLAQVSVLASRHLGVEITPRMVRKCWDDWKAFRRSLISG
jgi:hypothetical protein